MTRLALRRSLEVLLLVIWLSCRGDNRVFVIENINTLQTTRCIRISMARATEMSMEEAERCGYRPCHGCQLLASN